MQTYANESDANRESVAAMKQLGEGWTEVKYTENNVWYVYWHRGNLFVHKELKGYSAFISLTEGSLVRVNGSTSKVLSKPAVAIQLEIEHVEKAISDDVDDCEKESIRAADASQAFKLVVDDLEANPIPVLSAAPMTAETHETKKKEEKRETSRPAAKGGQAKK
jgi:hypothetical protein